MKTCSSAQIGGQQIPTYQFAPDFKYKKSAMRDLSQSHQHKIELLIISPKYYCKLAWEGIEYGQGLFKNYYQWTSHVDKKEEIDSLAVSKMSESNGSFPECIATCSLTLFWTFCWSHLRVSHGMPTNRAVCQQDSAESTPFYCQPGKCLYCKSVKRSAKQVSRQIHLDNNKQHT